MKKRIVAVACCFALMSACCFAGESWYGYSKTRAVEIISRADGSVSDKKLGKFDDRVTIDFMDFSLPKNFTREGKVLSDVKETENGYNGKFEHKGLSGQAECRIEDLGERKFRFRWRFSSDTPTEMKDAYFSVLMRHNMMGRKLAFKVGNDGEPVKQMEVEVSAEKNGWLWSSPKGTAVREIVIPMNGGELKVSGGFVTPKAGSAVTLLTWDKYRGDIRIYAGEGVRQEVKGALDVEFVPWVCEPVNIASAANMGFKDEVGNDKLGGWTDQGPDNDLSAFAPGEKKFGHIRFDVLDPDKNAGKGCMVFANKARPYFLTEASLPVDGKAYDYLYMLHAAAWTVKGKKAGEIAVKYVDGTEQVITVTDGRDVSNWWSPNNCDNAAVAWRAQNRSSFIGLYMSRFAVQDKPVASLDFRTGNEDVWAVVAISGVRGKQIPFAMEVDREVPIVIKEGKDWKKFEYVKVVEPGSALDFSFFTGDAPAGTLGKLMVKGDKFYFEKAPDKPVRFFGGNITSDGTVMDENELAYFPRQLKMLGYNAVRLHHFDKLLVKPGTKLEFDPEQLDRFFKTFAAFKEHGLYITLDLFTIRKNGFADGKDYHHFIRKILIMFDPESRKSMEEFSRILLTTENPYTGMSLAEDPALISVGMINENPRIGHHDMLKYPNTDPYLNDIYKKAFEKWCAEKGLPVVDRPDAATWAQFMTESHISGYNHWKKFLTSIGITVPTSDISCSHNLILAVPRTKFDYTDMHFYHDHPKFKPNWKLPMTYGNNSTIEDFEVAPRPAASRIFGKPVMVTEWHYCAINQYRAEAGPVGGAMLALQDIDGVFDFNPVGYKRSWGDPTKRMVMGCFSTFTDPIAFMNARIIAMLYMRGDVKPATDTYVLNVPSDIYKDKNALDYTSWGLRFNAAPQDEFKRLGFIGKIGIRVGAPTGAANEFTNNGIIAERKKDDPNWLLKKMGLYNNGEIVSSTGQIRLNPKQKRFTVVTDKSEALVQQGKENGGSALSVTDNSTFSTVFAGALDDNNLVQSRRVLLFHLTDVVPQCKLAMLRDRLIRYNWGKYPFYVRKGTAKVSLKNTAPGKATLYALDMTGKRVAEVAFEEKDGVLTFDANNDMGEFAPLAYELIRAE